MLKNTFESVVRNALQPTMVEVITAIVEYHKQLQWPKPAEPFSDEQLRQHRDMVTALMAEVIEVLDAAPWKPWKSYALEYDVDCSRLEEVHGAVQTMIAEELVDCFFFIVSILEIWKVTPEQFVEAFQAKLKENLRRLSAGYNKPPNGESHDTRN